jgi:tRNA(Ile)-lysidine synthase
MSPDDFNQLCTGRILIACSGGADSVALAVIASDHKADCVLAYVEHSINPETFDCERIVKNAADVLGFEFALQRLDPTQWEDTSNLEERARELRYQALENLRKEHNCDVIATAHHADDVVETFLINLVRGGGSGAASLSPRRGNIVRPLLSWRKDQLVQIVKDAGLEYFSDPANDDSRFVRNRIRHEVIPLLDDIAGRDVTELIARTAKSLREDEEFLRRLAKSMWPKDKPTTNDLAQLDPVLQVHALRAWISGMPPSREEMDRILGVVHKERTATQISGHRTIRRSGGVLHQDKTSTNNEDAP